MISTASIVSISVKPLTAPVNRAPSFPLSRRERLVRGNASAIHFQKILISSRLPSLCRRNLKALHIRPHPIPLPEGEG